MTLENTHGILMPHLYLFSSLLQTRFHIQFSHCTVTPIPLRVTATTGSLVPSVSVYMCCYWSGLCLSSLAPAALITAVWGGGSDVYSFRIMCYLQQFTVRLELVFTLCFFICNVLKKVCNWTKHNYSWFDVTAVQQPECNKRKES